jgi:hypothetical protein
MTNPSTSINLSKIKKKLNPEPDGQGPLRLQSATISAIASDGTVDILLNSATVSDVPVLGSARFVSGQAVQVLSYRGSLLVLGGSGIQAGQPVQAEGTTSNGTTSSTSFTNSLTTTGIHGVAFIAPPSGRVYVVGRALAGNNTAGAFVHLDVEVRVGATVGSGSVWRAANNNTASAFQSSTASQQATLIANSLVTGLTPGAAYNAALCYFVTTGTNVGSYNRRHISVLPQ